MRVPVGADRREAERFVAAAGAHVVRGNAEQHPLEGHLAEEVLEKRAQRLGPVSLPEIGRVKVDAEHRRSLLEPHVAQEDATHHLAGFVVDGVRQLPLATGNVVEPARTLLGRHAPWAGPDQELVLVVWPSLPGVNVGARERPHARARAAGDGVAVGDGHRGQKLSRLAARMP